MSDYPSDAWPALCAYEYRAADLVEVDWRRFPGWHDVSPADWASPDWQRAHSVTSVAGLRRVFDGLLLDDVYDDLAEDQRLSATMSLRVTPQMINTMCLEPGLDRVADSRRWSEAFRRDAVRRYMMPLAGDRLAEWGSHPLSRRDPLHETDMWAAAGLTHRYPTKLLAELTTTCAQYCGHCTRMDLVGPSTAVVEKATLSSFGRRQEQMLDYLRRHPEVRDVVVSGGDVANVPWPRVESFVEALIMLGSIKDVRLASKSLIGLPQHWLQPHVLEGLHRLAALASDHGVSIAVHTHANAAQSITPTVAAAARAILSTGVRDVRNQGVLLAGVNDSSDAILDLCFALLDGAGITPYYFYLCDMIPNSEHWRLPLRSAIDIQERIMGWLPGFATPRLVCDVPLLGKRWVHQFLAYDEVRGISTWGGENASDGQVCSYYDPIHLLPPAGQRYWSEVASDALPVSVMVKG